MQIPGNLRVDKIFFSVLYLLDFAVTNLDVAKMSFRFPYCNPWQCSFSQLSKSWNALAGDDDMDFILFFLKNNLAIGILESLGAKSRIFLGSFHSLEINESVSIDICASICPWKLPSHQQGLKFLYSLYNR